METFLMFWALLNFVVSIANAVNLRKLKQSQAEIDAMREELQGYFDNVAEEEQ